MGSVVFRDADLKFYLDASSEERARRRFRERDGTGDSATYEEIREAIESRDSRDRNRVDSPLIEPEGAIRVCTDGWTVEQTIDFLVGEVEKKRST